MHKIVYKCRDNRTMRAWLGALRKDLVGSICLWFMWTVFQLAPCATNSCEVFFNTSLTHWNPLSQSFCCCTFYWWHLIDTIYAVYTWVVWFEQNMSLLPRSICCCCCCCLCRSQLLVQWQQQQERLVSILPPLHTRYCCCCCCDAQTHSTQIWWLTTCCNCAIAHQLLLNQES